MKRSNTKLNSPLKVLGNVFFLRSPRNLNIEFDSVYNLTLFNTMSILKRIRKSPRSLTIQSETFIIDITISYHYILALRRLDLNHQEEQGTGKNI